MFNLTDVSNAIRNPGSMSKSAERMLRRRLRNIEVPEDLDSVTSIDIENEVAAEEVGLSQADVDVIWRRTQNLFRTGAHPMVSLCIRRGGKIILNRSIGYQCGDALSEDAIVADLNTPVCMFSASKAIGGMLVHLLAEQGHIHLLDPISYYIPAFAAKGKHNITIYQLLAHRAGIPGLGDDVDPSTLFQHDEVLKILCQAEPLDKEGRTLAYHAITGGFIIDELIRVTTGMNAQQYLDRYVRKPMGMRYFSFGLSTRDIAKVAENRNTGPKAPRVVRKSLEKILGAEIEEVTDLTNAEEFRRAILPSANLYSTAEEASRFYQMLLDYGRYGEQQVFQPLTVHRAIQETGKAEKDHLIGLPMRYSPAFMRGGRPAGLYGVDTHYAFGHPGFANIFAWADPERDISVALLNSGKPLINTHLPALLRLLFGISKRCSPVRDMSEQGAYFFKRED